LKWTDNIRLIESLCANRLLKQKVAEQLADAYRNLRAVLHRHTLGELPGLIGEEELSEERALVRQQWQLVMQTGDS
jgi:glutamate-ammonia-ligase adenylyltransferase